MLEQMGKTAEARRLVFGAHVIPDIHGHDGSLAVGMHDHAQAVRQGEFFISDINGRFA